MYKLPKKDQSQKVTYKTQVKSFRRAQIKTNAINTNTDLLHMVTLTNEFVMRQNDLDFFNVIGCRTAKSSASDLE